MTTEAALLGVPTFSCYPDKPFLVEKYLIAKGLIVRETELERLQTKLLATLANVESIRKTQIEKAKRLTSGFEDPIRIIVDTIETLS